MPFSKFILRIFTVTLLFIPLAFISCDDDDEQESPQTNQNGQNGSNSNQDSTDTSQDDQDSTDTGQNENLTLGVTTNVDTLIETNEDTAILNFQFSDDPPQEGFEVALTVSVDDGSSKPLARFKIASFNEEEDIQGGELVERPKLSQLNSLVLLLTEQQASVTLITSDDTFDNGPLNVSFSIQESDDYEISTDAKTATFTIVEN